MAEIENKYHAERPNAIRKLRACKNCRLIKTYDQFYENYCDNCAHTRPESDVPGMKQDFVENETTNDFEGMVSLMQPESSWVARWLKLNLVDVNGNKVMLKTGLYAISLPGVEFAEKDKAAEDNFEEDEEDEEANDVDGEDRKESELHNTDNAEAEFL